MPTLSLDKTVARVKNPLTSTTLKKARIKKSEKNETDRIPEFRVKLAFST